MQKAGFLTIISNSQVSEILLIQTIENIDVEIKFFCIRIHFVKQLTHIGINKVLYVYVIRVRGLMFCVAVALVVGTSNSKSTKCHKNVTHKSTDTKTVENN